jgi:hypothetical protein
MRRKVMWTATLSLGAGVAVAVAHLALSTRADVPRPGGGGKAAPISGPPHRAESARPTPSFLSSPPALPVARHTGADIDPASLAHDGEPVPRSAREHAELLARQRIEREHERQQIFERMSRESRDPTWAAGVETALGESIRALEPGHVSIESIECRSTSCALVMSHPNSDAQARAMHDLAGKPGFRAAGRAHLEFGDGIETRTYVFLSRDTMIRSARSPGARPRPLQGVAAR